MRMFYSQNQRTKELRYYLTLHQIVLCSLQICRIITTICFKSELCLSTPKSRTKYHDLHLFPQNVRLQYTITFKYIINLGFFFQKCSVKDDSLLFSFHKKDNMSLFSQFTILTIFSNDAIDFKFQNQLYTRFIQKILVRKDFDVT